MHFCYTFDKIITKILAKYTHFTRHFVNYADGTENAIALNVSLPERFYYSIAIYPHKFVGIV